MKLKYTLPLLGLGLSSLAVNAQSNDWITDTIHMEENYKKTVYYSLENGSLKSVDNDTWHLGFRADLFSVGVYANHAGANVRVFELFDADASTKFGTDLTGDTASVTAADPSKELFNSITSWDTGALNQNRDVTERFDLGWGFYDMGSHTIEGDKIYLVTTNTNAYQVWIEKDLPFGVTNPPEWTFHIADIDGNNSQTIVHYSKPDYENRLFAYLNLETKTFQDIDPENKDWDFQFTRYKELVSQGPVSMWYPVTGVLSNQNPLSNETRPTLAIRGEDALTAVWSTALESEMNTLVNGIGRDWRLSPNQDGGYNMDTVTYFIKTSNSAVWQLEFLLANQGTSTDSSVTPGMIVLRKKEVEKGVSIDEINTKFNSLVIAPNPASTNVTILIDAKENMKNASISISDISGRVLNNQVLAIEKGNQQIPLDISNLTSGMYFISITADQVKITNKLIVK